MAISPGHPRAARRPRGEQHDDPPCPQSYLGSAELNRAVDVAVIGGGIVGTAAALELARGGASVALFEAAAIGAGASGRNSGSVQYPFDEVLEPLYDETVERYHRLAAEAPDRFAFPERPAGLLLVAADPEVLNAEHAFLRQMHPRLEPVLMSSAELKRVEPRLASDLAAVRLETGYPIPPAAAVEAFASLTGRAGVSIHVGDGPALDRQDGRIAGVRGADGSIVPSAAVLVAAGPWSSAIIEPGGHWTPILRSWGVTVALKMADPPRHVVEEVGVGAIARGEGPGEPTMAADRAGEPVGHFPSTFSLVTAAGVSVVGSTFLPEEPDVGSVGPLLLHRADRFIPGLHGVGVDELRACARPQSLDGRPLIGRVPGYDNLFIAAGHGPWGISTGPETARMVADLILGRETTIPPELDPARFPGP